MIAPSATFFIRPPRLSQAGRQRSETAIDSAATLGGLSIQQVAPASHLLDALDCSTQPQKAACRIALGALGNLRAGKRGNWKAAIQNGGIQVCHAALS